MKDFYEAFYTITEHSPVHHQFCERVFGRDLCQHGFASLEQLDLLLKASGLGAGMLALDLGCGNGLIAEYLSDCSGARITGLDYIPLAIQQAQARTTAKRERLDFAVGDINHLRLPPGAYDLIISIDTIYFSNDMIATLQALKTALKPGGKMAFLYAYGRLPWVPKEEFPRESLAPDKTPLAVALQAVALTFQTWDLTQQDYDLALCRKAVLAELKPQFESESAMFIFDNRMGDAEGVRQAVEDGLHARYLYVAKS